MINDNRGVIVEIIATNTDTGEETVYPSIKEAADALGCSVGNVSRAANDGYACCGYKVRKGKRKPIRGGANICFDCKKACGGCSWSEIDPDTKKPRFQPVEGWMAKPVKIGSRSKHSKEQFIDTYSITACPLFEPDDPRKRDSRQMSVEQSEHFLENLGRYLQRWSDG